MWSSVSLQKLGDVPTKTPLKSLAGYGLVLRLLYEMYPHLRGGRGGNHFEKFIIPDRDSILNLLVIDSLVYYESSALDLTATEADKEIFDGICWMIRFGQGNGPIDIKNMYKNDKSRCKLQ
ncbi:unnamed protein product [Timema podura]|uniref:LAGLIDADG homing endonuclease n=1 Tax=Timema podura TaxID=61482 RepID=A0ABN7PEK9_TIMPD|nr:unnamed protein product [Timema podura]